MVTRRRRKKNEYYFCAILDKGYKTFKEMLKDLKRKMKIGDIVCAYRINCDTGQIVKEYLLECRLFQSVNKTIKPFIMIYSKITFEITEKDTQTEIQWEQD